MNYRVAVGLGSNLGDRLHNLRRAVEALGELGVVESVSSLYETAPVGGPDQGPYLNAVLVLATHLEPDRLLEDLLEIEDRMGRERRERWGPRTLDLDLIAVVAGDEPVQADSDRLRLPHPRAHLRRFVLDPLCEVWPSAPLAGGEPAVRFLAGVHDQEVERLGQNWTGRRLGVSRVLLAGQALLFVGYASALRGSGRPPAGAMTTAARTLAAAGVLLAGWGVVSLDRAASPYPEPRPGVALVAHGPYRLVRHPIYTGLVMAMTGLALARRSPRAVTAGTLLAGYFSVKARYEESRLRLSVPGYAAYQRRVRGRMLPGTKAST